MLILLPLESYISRLNTLFWIAVSNFVFPVILNIVQLIFAYQDPDFSHGICIFLANNYVGAIGALFATVWCSSEHWIASGGGVDLGRTETTLTLSLPVFAAPPPPADMENPIGDGLGGMVLAMKSRKLGDCESEGNERGE